MTTYAERLQQAMERASIKPAGLARRLDVSYTAVAKVLNGKSNGFGTENNFKAAHFLNCDPHWLATGQGVAPYQNVSLNMVNLSMGINQIPVLDRKTSGMFESYLTGMAEPAQTLPYHAATGTTFAYAVDDDVMEPDFRAGTIAYIETGTPPQHGDIVLVQDGGDAVLRKLVIDGGIQYLDTINQRLPMRQLTGQVIGWVSGEYRPRRTV